MTTLRYNCWQAKSIRLIQSLVHSQATRYVSIDISILQRIAISHCRSFIIPLSNNFPNVEGIHIQIHLLAKTVLVTGVYATKYQNKKEKKNN